MMFSYNYLQLFFKKKLPRPEKLAELLTLHFAEVEEIKKEKGDFIFSIDVSPNRGGDCLSHLGVARECAAILNYKLSAPATGLPDKRISRPGPKLKTKDLISVEVKARGACIRYTAGIVADVKVGPSPKWLKNRLEVCGLNSINNIVDAANYVMLETGQPLHAFDFEKLADKKIIVRFAKNGEKIITLDNQQFDLNPKILIIATPREPVAIAGIKGGKIPEITKDTKIVVLESANFNSAVVRRASREISLKTDASLRFEHGFDPNMTELAVNKAACLIRKISGGDIAEGLADFYPRKVYPRKIKLNLNYLESLLGIKIPEKEAINILTKLGFGARVRRNQLLAEAPTFRQDASTPEDLIEEIGRIYGYDKIPPVFPTASLIPPPKNNDIFWENSAKNLLKEIGFTEVYNYSFQKDPPTSSGRGGEIIEVENPISQEYKYLRQSLIPNLVRNIQKNIKGFNEIKIFELGKIFVSQTEKNMLAGITAGQDFYQLKGAVDFLLNKLGIADVWYDDYLALPVAGGKQSGGSKPLWHPKKSAEIKVGNDKVGFLGELTGELKAAAFDIDFDKLKTLANEENEYRPISRYPASIRDLAVLVPLFTKIEEVLNVIEIAGGEPVSDVDLFDIYEGDKIPDGRKNLAFHIIYQAEDRTLTSIEVYKIHQKIIKSLEENPEWQVRR